MTKDIAKLSDVCKALCDNWPKIPDGCAALCMQRLGGLPETGCAYRVQVHGKMARAVIKALAP